MATSIGVEEATRDRLEQVKRALRLPSLDRTIAALLEERVQRAAAATPGRLLSLVARNRDALRTIAKKHQIRRVAVFGSAIHGDERPESDLDLLVEFDPRKKIGLIGLGEVEADLGDALGVRVDLQTPDSLSPYFRKEVLAEALDINVAA